MNRYREERPERIFFWILVCLLVYIVLGGAYGLYLIGG